jgi:hypothetical protein
MLGFLTAPGFVRIGRVEGMPGELSAFVFLTRGLPPGTVMVTLLLTNGEFVFNKLVNIEKFCNSKWVKIPFFVSPEEFQQLHALQVLHSAAEHV